MFDSSFFYTLSKNKYYKINGTPEHFYVSLSNQSKGEFEMVLLENGCILGFSRVRGESWPSIRVLDINLPANMLIINICLKGRCDLFLSDDTFISLTDHRLAFSTKAPGSDYLYYDHYYDGLKFYIDLDVLASQNKNILDRTGIDFYEFIQRFNCDKQLYFQFTTPWIDQICAKLWSIRGSELIGKMRILSTLLIHELTELPSEAVLMSLLSRHQLSAVIACEKLLCENLSVRYSLEELSKRFYVNRNSLKAHFKKVYGKTLTEYMTEKRMEAARQMLENKDLDIAHISEKVGYENASKFAAVFKKFYGSSPSEYRKENLLNKR